MKALVYHGNKDLRLETVPDPTPERGQIKLRVDYCGICATDIEEYLYGPVFIAGSTPNPLTGKKMPVITGHEITGTIAEVTEGVTNVRPGDRVVLNGVLTCKKCWWCARGLEQQCSSRADVGFAWDGGLAEYLVWPAAQVVKLPNNVSSEEAGLNEPCSVAVHAVRRARIQPGERVAILGVGTVGMLTMQAARAMGAAKVFAIDQRQMSLDIARQLGADAVINSAATDAANALRDLTDGVGPDVVIDAAGAKTTPELAVKWARKGGRALLVAIYASRPEFDFNSIVAAEIEVIGSVAYQQRDIEEAVRFISTGAIKTKPLISDKIGLSEVIDKGFARMLAPTKDVFRILVSPSK